MQSPLRSATPSNELIQPGRAGEYQRPKRRFSKDEAWGMLEKAGSYSERGRDPIHLALQREWFINVAYYLGATNFTPASGFLDIDPTLYNDEQGFNANFVQRFVRYQVAQLTSGEPKMSVMAKSPDPDDTFAAKVGEFFLAHYDDQLNFRQLRRDAAFWLVTCGNAFPRVDWDALAGREIKTFKDPYTDEPMWEGAIPDEHREALETLGKVDKRREGMMDTEVFSPFQVTIPRRVRSLRRCPWIVLEYERDMDWVSTHYPRKYRYITPEETGSHDTLQYWERLATLYSRGGSLIPTSGSQDSDIVRIRELWHLPSHRYPNGLWVRGTQHQLLDHGPHPYHDAGIDINEQPWMAYPVDHWRYSPVPGRFWGMGLVEHLIGPQRDYDVGVRQMIQQRDRLAVPQWLKPQGVEMASTRNEVGDIWEYTVNGQQILKPELQQAPNVSNMHVDARVRAYEEMQVISSQGEATQGAAPQGMRSGVALRALQEKDNMTISATVQEMEEGFERFCTRLLTLTHEFMDIPKAIQTYGEMRAGDIQVFAGSALHGNVQVRIRRGSMMPRSEAEAMSTMLEMIQTGAVDPTDPMQAEMIYRNIKVEGADRLFEHRNGHIRRAEHENHLFLYPNVQDGQMPLFPAVEEFDDHMVHVQKHMDLMVSDAFEMMPEARKMALRAHVRQHQMAIAQAQMAMATAQAQMQGGGGGGSPPREPGQASQPRPRGQNPQQGQA